MLPTVKNDFVLFLRHKQKNAHSRKNLKCVFCLLIVFAHLDATLKNNSGLIFVKTNLHLWESINFVNTNPITNHDLKVICYKNVIRVMQVM